MLTPHRLRTRHLQQPPTFPFRQHATHPNDRRRRTRLPSATEGWLIPDTGDLSDPWEVRIADVSRHGVGFECTSPLEEGEVVRIRIGRGPLNLSKRLRVVSCRPGAQGTFVIGGEFLVERKAG